MQSQEPCKRKVAVFGLDGVTFDLITPWLEEGRLPNLAKLLADGASGPLRSTIPPVSASAWASFSTGTNPGQHGLVDFTYPAPGDYQIKISNSHARSAPALWEIVSEAGGQVGVVSMPMTYPPQPLNGFMLCSFLTPSGDSRYTYPDNLQEQLIAAAGAFPLHMSEKGRGKDPSLFVRAVKQMEVERARTVCHLLQYEPWDLFLYVVETTDNLQHEVWHLLDETHPQHDSEMARRVLPDILDYYQTVDHLLGQMMALVPDDAMIVVLSDHGFGPFHKFFHINNWLAQRGWLKFRRTPWSLLKRLAFKLGVTPINALRWVTFFRLGGLRKNVKRGRGGGMLRRLFLSFNDVDWQRTKAFSVGNFGQVYLNVQGERPSGTVSADEYDQLCQEIAEAALAFRDETDSSQVVKQVYRREELFHGRRARQLPDLVLHTDRAKYVSFGHADFGSNRVIEPSVGQTGHHHLVGIVGMKGPGLRQGFSLDEASILDLAPTILHYLGLSVPTHMDGQVLNHAFTDEFNRQNPVVFRSSNLDQNEPHDDHTYDEEEEAAVMAKLRDLGYVA